MNNLAIRNNWPTPNSCSRGTIHIDWVITSRASLATNALAQDETQTSRLKATKLRDVNVMRSDGKANDATRASRNALETNVEEGAHLGT